MNETHFLTNKGTNIVKICQPKCDMECINGTCIEVNTCSCFEGYEFLKDSFNVCEPVCDPPCLNGNCVKPNVCSCDPGNLFKLNKNKN